jgi:hypothetical protein
MKKLSNKLALNREVVRRLAADQLSVAHGGRINQSASVCNGECPPPSANVCLSDQCVMTDACH